jgi:DNA-directed RNA polymerase subunit L
MEPEVVVKQNTGARAVFVVRHIDMAVANALRRIMLAEVDNVAVAHASVLIAANTCPLHDDIMAKRVAMVPVKLSAAEVAAYVPNSLTLELSVKNEGKLPLDVTTADVVPFLHGRPYPERTSLLPPCPVTGDHILLTRLQPGQEIRLAATANKGTASTHASYAVASVASYGYEIDEAAAAAAREALVLSLEGADKVDRRNALNRFDTIDRQRFYLKQASGDPTGYEFVVETESGLDCSEIVGAALRVMKAKFASPAFTHDVIRGDDTHVRFTIEGEDHTLGGVLQSTAVDHGDELGLVSTGYFKPHPLEPRISVLVKSAAAVADPGALLTRICLLCVQRVAALEAAFAKVF